MPPQIEYPAANKIAEKIAAEIGCRPQQVLATAALLDEGHEVASDENEIGHGSCCGHPTGFAASFW